MRHKQADIMWRDGQIPVSRRFDDPYFSLEDGWAETRHVFLGGNDLPARFRDGFVIAELGFGTGLNCLAAQSAWIASGQTGQLRFVSFEAYPMAPADMETALSAFPDLAAPAEALRAAISDAQYPARLPGGVDLTVVQGDARQTLPHWQGLADAWFLDGFAPARNPELWQVDLLAEVARHTRPQGTAATYTAAGAVRRGLQQAGFDVTRVPGYGRKRHMTRARLR